MFEMKTNGFTCVNFFEPSGNHCKIMCGVLVIDKLQIHVLTKSHEILYNALQKPIANNAGNYSVQITGLK